jgi:hypothetical protein
LIKEIQMNLFRALYGSTRTSWNAPETSAGALPKLDEPAGTDWRKQRLELAARKYGRPFKCAGEDLLREVFVGGGELVTVGGGEKPGSAKSVEPRPAPTFPKRGPRSTLTHGS